MSLSVKLTRDLGRTPARTAAIIAALALGLVAFCAVTGAYGVLSRELPRNYQQSVPASFTLMLDRASKELLRSVRERPDVAAATRRATLSARYRARAGSAWQRALVFVVDDFERPGVAELLQRQGTVPPPLDEVLIERSAMDQLGLGLGGRFELRLAGAEPKAVTVAGTVHEPALAPAKTEQAIYAYMTAQTARALGASGEFDELRVLVRDGQADLAAIERVAEALANEVTSAGLATVHGIRVPPPLQHPHQTQMMAVLSLFVVWSALAWLLSGVLAAALIGAWLARQIREIGVMKALGAGTARLVLGYGCAVAVLSGLALLVAWVPGKYAGLALAESVANVLNFDLASREVPANITRALIAAALSVPVLLALPSVVGACRVSVKAALGDYGMGARRTSGKAAGCGSSGPGAAVTGLFGTGLFGTGLFGYALRGVVRRRRQLGLSVGLLAVAGAGVVGAGSVAKAWDSLIGEVERTRHYAVEVHLHGAPNGALLAERVARVPGVQGVEVWRTAPTAVGRQGRPAIERTYPDDAHGAFRLVAPPDRNRLLQVDVAEGRWIRPDDAGMAVINQFVPGYETVRVGGEIAVSVAGKVQHLRVVGKTVQIGVGATAYVSARTFDAIVPLGEARNELWIAASPESREQLTAFTAGIERELALAHADVAAVVPVSLVKNAMAAHFEVLVNSLLALAVMIAAVGALGLGSALGVSVSERTREFGVLRAIGATSAEVRNAVVLEGLLIGAASLGPGLVVGLGLTAVVGDVVGTMSFKVPLPLVLSGGAVAVWSAAALALAVLGGLGPAARAGNVRVREALTWLLVA